MQKVVLMSDCKKRVERMEKDFIFLKGKEREFTRREYFKLLKSCSNECGLEDPIYLD